MKNNNIIKKQYLKYILLNSLVFTVIFSIFGFFVFNNMESSLYSTSDEELYRTYEMILNINKKPLDNSAPNSPDRFPSGIRNPNVSVIQRDLNGNIVAYSGLEDIYIDYFQNFNINEKNLGIITNYEISDSDITYNYRSLVIKLTNKGNTEYLQLLINVRGEQSAINNFKGILIFAVFIAVILSLIASVFLAKHTLKPIISSWDKQVEFVENASHELRTPLTIIQNKLEQLLKTPNEKIIDRYENIALPLSETRRLSKMVSNLLTLARADSNATELEKDEFSLDNLIEEVVSPYSDLATLEEKTLSLSLNSKENIYGDKARIHQLMVILLDNALKYTSSLDTITVSTWKKDSKFIIEVKDTGIGVSDEGLKKIFDRFYREDRARSRESGGSGLGLSIAKYIVEKHEGSISATKNLPKGTIFKIKI